MDAANDGTRTDDIPDDTDADARAGDDTGTDLVRNYYAAIDAHDYDRLASLLAPSFVHHRPDRTLDGCATFVEFMREKRPMADTSHEIRTVYPNGHGVAAQGRLLDADGEEIFAFVDVFGFDSGGRIETLHTYTE